MTSRICVALFGLVLVTISGCTEEETTPVVRKKSEPGGIQRTSDIGEYDPNANKEVVDSSINVSNNPLTYALEAREQALEQIADFPIRQGVDLFHATEGRYPKDHEEFMTRVVKANNIRLPKLAAGKRYEYDVENHKLMIVYDPPAEQKK